MLAYVFWILCTCARACARVFVVFMLSGTFKRIPRWHFFETECRKGHAPPLVCVCLCVGGGVGRWVFVCRRVIWKVKAGWVCLLFSVHLQPIKRQDWQIFSSSFSPSPTPARASSSLSPPPLCRLFILSSFPRLFTIAGWGLAFGLEMTF